MERRSLAQTKKHRETAMKKRSLWEGLWRDAFRFCLPQRDVINQLTPGSPKGDLVFDSTGQIALASFANRVQGSMFSPGFVELLPGPSVPENQKTEAARQLKLAEEHFHKALQRSDFDVVINEFLLELGVGTGVMLFNKGTPENPFIFTSVTCVTCGLLAGPNGTVGEIHRDFLIAVGNIKETWPEAVLPQALKEKLAQDATQEVTVHEVSWKIDGGIYYDLWMSEPEEYLLPKPRKFDGVGPWIVTRFMKAANEEWGRGPALWALPDIRTANKVVELELKNAALAIVGTYTGVNDGVLNPNTARFIPGAIIPVARNDGPYGPSLKALERTGDFNIAQVVLETFHERINRTLFNNRLPPISAAVRSPTEIVERQRELQVDIGPAFSRLMRELVTPLVMRGLQILAELKIIEFPFRIDGSTVQLQITAPLAKQAEMDDVASLATWLEMMGGLGPEMIMYGAKVEDIPAWLGNKLGVDPKLIRTGDERAGIEQLVSSILQRMQQQAGAGTQAAVQNAAGPPQQQAA